MEDDGFLPFRVDFVTPQQFADLHRSTNGDDAPTKRLMLAVLEISLRDATGTRYTANVRRWKLSPRARARADAQRSRRASEQATSAIDWIFDDAGDGVFSFLNICDVLAVDSERLRARVRERTVEKRAA